MPALYPALCDGDCMIDTPEPFRTFMLVLVNDDCERGVINTARSTNDRCVP